MTVGNAQQTSFDIDSPVPGHDEVKTAVPVAKVSENTARSLKTILDKFKCEELLNEIKDIINVPGIQKDRKSMIIEILVKETLEHSWKAVYVYGLPKRYETYALVKLLERYGRVRYCYKDKNATIVVLSPAENAYTAADALNNTTFEGRKLKLQVSCSVYVYNLPKGTDSDELASIFQEYDVKFCEIAQCYGSVILENDAAANAAIKQINGSSYKGHHLVVAKEKKRGFDDYLNDLELRFIQLHSDRRLWAAFRMYNPVAWIDGHTRPGNFQKRFQKCLLKSKLDCSVSTVLHHNQLWNMITIKKKDKKIERCFVLCFHRVPIICHSSFKKFYEDDVYRAVMTVFVSTAKEVFIVKNKNLNHLLAMCCDESGIEEADVPNLPLLPTSRGRKRPAAEEESEDEEPEQHPDIFDEDLEEDIERRTYAKNIFRKKVQPVNKLVFDVKSDFFGDIPTNERLPAVCRVILRGQDVAKGLKKFIYSGISHCPLPRYLSDSQNKYCDYFRVMIGKRNDDADTSS